MIRIPPAALLLGYLGLLPFLYAVALVFSSPGSWPTMGFVTSDPRGGLDLLERFGAAILAFMGGCLWGFASSPGRLPGFGQLAGSTIPAAIAFAAIHPGNPALSCVWLAFGFAALQAIDVAFQKGGVAPAYWLSLRLPLTAVVITCLLIGALYG